LFWDFFVGLADQGLLVDAFRQECATLSEGYAWPTLITFRTLG
jgi:hypothetical protein